MGQSWISAGNTNKRSRWEQECLELIKQRPRRLISPGMESGSEGAADRDRIHSRWCGRGSSPFQLNPTTAVLQCAHIVEGFLFHCTCTVTPSPALKAGTTLFLHFDWMISTHGREAAASSGVVGSSGCQGSQAPGAPRGWRHNPSCCCHHQPAGTAVSD